MKTIRSALGDILLAVVLCLLLFAVQVRNVNLPFFSLLANALYMVNFVIHEIGHVLFGFFGQFVGILGGTLAQLLFPTMAFLVAATRNKRLQACFFTFWIGESLTEVSVYISDAQSQQLKLISPFTLFSSAKPLHDWHFLLGKMNLLWADQIIGKATAALGFLIMCAAIVSILIPWIVALRIAHKKTQLLDSKEII